MDLYIDNIDRFDLDLPPPSATPVNIASNRIRTIQKEKPDLKYDMYQRNNVGKEGKIQYDSGLDI